ncbi:MAG: hypothetical protein AAFN04_02085 [Pseudomonadota bacterium]
MNYFLWAVFAVLAALVVFSLIKGVVAFLRTTRINLESGEGETVTEMQNMQNKAMFARIKYQAAAIAVVVVIGLLAAGNG